MPRATLLRQLERPLWCSGVRACQPGVRRPAVQCKAHLRTCRYCEPTSELFCGSPSCASIRRLWWRWRLAGPAAAAPGAALDGWESVLWNARKLQRAAEDLGAALYPPQASPQSIN